LISNSKKRGESKTFERHRIFHCAHSGTLLNARTVTLRGAGRVSKFVDSKDCQTSPEASFLKRSWCLRKKFAPTGKVALLAPRREVGAYASFKKTALWRRGAVGIASASGTRRHGFESCQGIRFLGKHSSAIVYKMT
jgi:hypothetical protein